MQDPASLEAYPVSTVLVSNLVPVLIYAIGIYLLLQSGLLWVAAYLVFVLILEYRLLSRHCVDCYYYGKCCAFGKGSLSARFFRRGRPERFSGMTISWKDIVPDFLVFIIPVIAGILILVQGFSWTVLALVIALLLLGFLGNALVRGKLACRYCRQREIGCPAQALFDKKG
jgi:hypothetical protein